MVPEAFARRFVRVPRLFLPFFFFTFCRYISFARAVLKEDVAGEDTAVKKRPRKAIHVKRIREKSRKHTRCVA